MDSGTYCPNTFVRPGRNTMVADLDIIDFLHICSRTQRRAARQAVRWAGGAR